MSESITHNKYVRKIYDYVKTLINEEEKCFIQADMFECEKPCMFSGNYIPDVYYCRPGKLIIGEAKTFDDYNTEHSYSQYESYMNECSKFAGSSTVVICLPWQLFITAQKHFRLLKNKYSNNTMVVVLSDLGMEAII